MTPESASAKLVCPNFQFPTEGDRFETRYINRFRRQLDILLAIQRPEYPVKPGSVLILDNDAARFSPLRDFLRIANRLVFWGFRDVRNWRLGDKNDPLHNWTHTWGLDVVGLPAYAEKDGRHYLPKRTLSSYSHLFLRQSYLPQEEV